MELKDSNDEQRLEYNLESFHSELRLRFFLESLTGSKYDPDLLPPGEQLQKQEQGSLEPLSVPDPRDYIGERRCESRHSWDSHYERREDGDLKDGEHLQDLDRDEFKTEIVNGQALDDSQTLISENKCYYLAVRRTVLSPKQPAEIVLFCKPSLTTFSFVWETQDRAKSLLTMADMPGLYQYYRDHEPERVFIKLEDCQITIVGERVARTPQWMRVSGSIKTRKVHRIDCCRQVIRTV